MVLVIFNGLVVNGIYTVQKVIYRTVVYPSIFKKIKISKVQQRLASSFWIFWQPHFQYKYRYNRNKMSFYSVGFVACTVVCAALKYTELQGRHQKGAKNDTAEGESEGSAENASKSRDEPNEQQKYFQNCYLIVYVCAFFSDWLKGPYVYALYESYGYSANQIAILFLVGFGVSGISGPFVGAAADMFGRKRLCLAYFATYILSALCKPINSYLLLMIGRLLGGLGTSLLYTVFESWMVAEHNRRGYPQALLDDTFAKSTLYNGLSAVAAGLIAQMGASAMGFVGPFILALIPLGIGAVITFRTWRDDSSDLLDKASASSSNSDVNSSPSKNAKSNNEPTTIMSTVFDAMTVMREDVRILCLGMAQSLFEGAMYTFVFLWSPALCEGLTKAEIAEVPYGLIFAAFMVMIMAGSSMFSIMMRQHKLEMLPFVVHGASFICCIATFMCLGWSHGVFITFVLFEMICGVFFPVFGSLRAVYVPEKQRSTIMNFFRVPLNLFVVIVLIMKKNLSNETTFLICAVTHLVSLGSWFAFATINAQRNEAKGYSQVENRGSGEEAREENDNEEDFGSVQDV